MLLGYLYVSDQNYALRVAGEALRTPDGGWGEFRAILAPWDLPYSVLGDLRLEPLLEPDCLALTLPPWPRGLPYSRDPDRSRCRKIARLDAARELGNPDVVRVGARSGGNPRAERIRVRLDGEAFEGVYEPMILDQPASAPRYSVGERVSVVEFSLQEVWGLYCVRSLDRSIAECLPESGT